MNKGDNYTLVLLENIRDQNDVVIEAVGQMQDTIKTLATKDELRAVKDTVDTMYVALTETNKALTKTNKVLLSHDRRITKQEQIH